MRRVWLSVAAVVAAGGVLVGCGGSEDVGGPEKSETTATAAGEEDGEAGASEDSGNAEADATITKAGFKDHDVWGPNAYVVRYEITNNGDEAANYSVQLEFLDADGVVLGTTGVTADRLGPGKTQSGNTAPIDVDIRNGKLSDIKSVRVSEVQRTLPEA